MTKRESGEEHSGQATTLQQAALDAVQTCRTGLKWEATRPKKHAMSCAWKIAKNDNGRESGL